MAQQEYGAAQPIIDLARKAYNAVQNLPDPPKLKKPDTSWHDQKVREANESFRKAAEKKYVTKPAQGTVARKKPTASKPRPKKRLAGKG